MLAFFVLFSSCGSVRCGLTLAPARGGLTMNAANPQKKPKPRDSGQRRAIVASNRRARFDYQVIDTYEAGIELVGTEVKSCRAGKVQLRDAFGRVEKNTVWLVNVDIAQHATTAEYFQHDPKRRRRLLMHKTEARKLRGQLNQQGFTLVPLCFYFNDRNLLKVELALCRGKAKRDKREDIKRRDVSGQRHMHISCSLFAGEEAHGPHLQKHALLISEIGMWPDENKVQRHRLRLGRRPLG